MECKLFSAKTLEELASIVNAFVNTLDNENVYVSTPYAVPVVEKGKYSLLFFYKINPRKQADANPASRVRFTNDSEHGWTMEQGTLYEKLLSLVKKEAVSLGYKSYYIVANQNVLKRVVNLRPKTVEEIKTIRDVNRLFLALADKVLPMVAELP